MPNAPALTIREQSIWNPGQLPVQFDMLYVPKRISSDGLYVMQASIYNAAGAPLHTTTQPVPVLTQGHPSSNIQIFVEQIALPVIPTVLPTSGASVQDVPMQNTPVYVYPTPASGVNAGTVSTSMLGSVPCHVPL